MRISATDWNEHGWDLAQSVELSRQVEGIGCGSGGRVQRRRGAKCAHSVWARAIKSDLPATIRREAGIATGAVGMISDPAQAETILSTGQADVVLLAREMLRDPYWPRRAAKTLGVKIKPPVQYERAW